MAAKRSAKKSKRPAPPSARPRRGGYPCPTCDFVAKHAMGLGRHRSAIHGVKSRRSQSRRASGFPSVSPRSLAKMEKRLGDLERQHAALLRSLQGFLRLANRR